MKSIVKSLHDGVVSRSLRTRSGSAAVEFAIIAPVLIVLYFGGVDLTLALTCNQKIKHATGVVADLVAQSVKLNPEEVVEYFTAADAVLQPYKSKPLAISVSVLTIDANGLAKVAWSSARGMTKRKAGSTFSLPPGLTTPEQKSLVIAESTYAYAPLTRFVTTGTFNLSETVYARPRGRAAILCPNC
ncbi:TadE/TadG family type IV pilus assembly protein [Aureimonas sp. AU12]|uniref:TadE/TadG family type IV pilus assembly protein n=1 Tax=Aureimonas sp. AU12 TaxID=1638161 RepID=UPI00078027A9|nr:TadE/TadG family type IV pilus assembly protein [Aureimonas sp. AU12]